MKRFKESWEIQHDWQLIFPILGLMGLGYSAFKISTLIIPKSNSWVPIIISLPLFLVLLKITLWIFKKLEDKWILEYRWEMIRVFIVFAITGSSSVFIGRPTMALMGITKENLNPFIYWVLFVIIGLIFYQLLLVSFGWLFGQFKFFWEFEKKMLKRMGLKKLID